MHFKPSKIHIDTVLNFYYVSIKVAYKFSHVTFYDHYSELWFLWEYLLDFLSLFFLSLRLLALLSRFRSRLSRFSRKRRFLSSFSLFRFRRFFLSFFERFFPELLLFILGESPCNVSFSEFIELQNQRKQHTSI